MNGMCNADGCHSSEAEDQYVAGVYAGHLCERCFMQRYRQDLPNVVGGMSEDEIEALDYQEED